MRYVISTDEKGYKRRFLVRDQDGDENAASGIPSGPPDLHDLDWDAILKEINNTLADQSLFSWSDINSSTIGLGIISAVLKRYIAALYKEDQGRAKKQRLKSEV
jgi:hypothetical protein